MGFHLIQMRRERRFPGSMLIKATQTMKMEIKPIRRAGRKRYQYVVIYDLNLLPVFIYSSIITMCVS